jgi:WD40 repeat protein
MFRHLLCVLTALVVVGGARADDAALARISPRSTIKIKLEGGAQPHFVFSVDGKQLATWGEGPQVEVWDVATAKRIGIVEGLPGEASSVAFAPDGKTMAVGSLKDITLYSLPSCERQRILKGHTWYVQFLAYPPDGKTLTSQSINGNYATLKQWDVEKGQELKTAVGRFGFHVAAPDRKTTAFFSYRDVVLLDIATLKEREFPHASLDTVACAAFSPQGDLLVTGNGTGVFRYNVASGKVAQVHATHTQALSSVAAAPDGKTIASGSYDGTVVLWDTEKSRARLAIPAHNKGAILICYSPDGKSLYSASTAEPRVKVWDQASGKECGRLEAPAKAQVLRLEAVPDGGALAVLFADGDLKLVDWAKESATRP